MDQPPAHDTPDEPPVTHLATLQFANGGLFDSIPVGNVCLVRRTRQGTPGPTLCDIDRFDDATPGWSVGGGCHAPGMVHTPCPGCLDVARQDYPGLPVAGFLPLAEPFAEALGVTAYGHSNSVPTTKEVTADA
ncbi:hypothetical protein [Streptosporangium sp. NPDC002524]|uniref:hypothetical protein n=1 Tax=Streptosporangium sp. NPDC002524 TaxID=3154537 RepID=UPI003329B7C8